MSVDVSVSAVVCISFISSCNPFSIRRHTYCICVELLRFFAEIKTDFNLIKKQKILICYAFAVLALCCAVLCALSGSRMAQCLFHFFTNCINEWTNDWMNECSFVKIVVVVVLLEVLFLSPFARLQSLQSHTRSLSLSVFRFVMPAFIFTHYMRVSKCLHENPYTQSE